MNDNSNSASHNQQASRPNPPFSSLQQMSQPQQQMSQQPMSQQLACLLNGMINGVNNGNPPVLPITNVDPLVEASQRTYQVIATPSNCGELQVKLLFL